MKKIKRLLKKQGFTLVELIIVIAIIAILAVAAFMMLTKWLSKSRDSRRVADMETIKKALEIEYVSLGYYPEPDGKKGILDQNNNTMWYMGYVGDGVISEGETLTKAPIDPSDKSSYLYAVTLDKQEFQLGILLEKGETAFELLNSVLAIQREFTEEDINNGKSDIDGNYDGYVSYTTGVNTYIVRTDSLLLWSGNTLDTDGINTNLMIDDTPLGEEIQLYDLEILPDDTNDEVIIKAKEELGLSGDNIEGDKQAINILEEETKKDYVPIQYEYCTLGETIIAHSYTVDTYSATSVAFDESCEDIKTTRLCDDGTLSEGYENQSCVMEGAQDCDLDGTAVGHGESITVYQTSSIEWDSGDTCVGLSQERVCYNGTLDGSYTNLVCSKGEADNCDANSSYDYINNNGDTHRYDVPALNHGESDTPTVDVEENNGTYKYTLSVTCNDGTYNESETAPVLVDCDANYTANGEICEADDRVQICDGTLASNEEWNTSDTYTQIWDGSQWTPTKTANYDENPSIDDCRYRCKINYTWNGSSCDANTKSVSCSGTVPTNATAVTATTYTQTWNGTAWAPTISWTEGATTCGFSCNANYTWNGTSCEADGRTEDCGGTLPTNAGWNNSNTYGQIWNGSDWEPTKTANYSLTTSSDDCRYACLSGNHTEDSGTTCVSNTRSCAITNGAGSQDWEGGNSGTASDWGTCTVVSCDDNYSINGNTCGADTQTVSCGGSIPANASASTASTYSQTWDGSQWTPDVSWTEGAETCGFICDATDSNYSLRYYWNGTSCVKLSGVSNFALVSKTSTAVNLQRGNVTGTDTYFLRNYTDEGVWINNAKNTTYSFTGLIPGKTYSLGVVPVKTYNGVQINGTLELIEVTTDCSSGTHYESGSCLSDTRSCSITNGVGSQTWDGSVRGTCTVVSCNTNYTKTGNTCVSSTKTVSCGGSIPTNASASTASTYTQTWNGSAWAPTYSWTRGATTCGYSCNTNYTWDGDSCEANTKTVSCGGSIPTNASASTTSTYTQTWSGSAWAPTYSWTRGATTCGYSCDTNYTWDGDSCEANTKTVSCGGSIPTNASASTASTYTQTWNGSAWAPTYSWTRGATTCGYGCDTNYTWDGDSCEANTKIVSCGGSIPTNASASTVSTYTQIWNGSIWTPTTSWTKGATICGYSCDTNYTWDGDSCEANTKTVSCGGSIPTNASASTASTYTQTWNGSAWAPTYSWIRGATICGYGCDTNYTWDGDSCEANTKTVSCGGSIPTNASASTASTYTQTWNGSAWAPTYSWSNGVTTCGFACNTNYTWNGSSCEYIYKVNCKAILAAGDSTGNGIYTIDIDGNGGTYPFHTYCDMTYNGGGRTLIGRGRENWAWTNSGRNTSNVSINVGTTSAFVPAYYSSTIVDGIMGKNVKDLSDGVRIKRASNVSGASYQEIVWKFTSQTSWSWIFTNGMALNSMTINGTAHTKGNTNENRSTGLYNGRTRIFTRGWISHASKQGFSYGNLVEIGTNSSTNFLRENSDEGHSIPYTEVYVRN